MAVKLIQLIGHTHHILADISRNKKKVILRNPLLVQYEQPQPTEADPNPQPRVGLFPYFPPYVADTELVVDESNLSAEPINPVQPMADKYRAEFGGIQPVGLVDPSGKPVS